MALLEIACFDAESAITAWKAGADRIELCVDKAVGGTTPTMAAVESVKRQVTIPVYVMIRPRGGDFVYTPAEFQRMKEEVEVFKPLADAFVIGILDRGGNVDVARTSELVRWAAPAPCTFHRAFDVTRDLSQALEDVISTGCRTILTSGAHADASSGADALTHLVHQAAGRLQVVPGGHVRSENIREIRRVTGAVAFHSSGTPAGDSRVDPHEVRCMKVVLQGQDLAALSSPATGLP